MLSSTEAKHIVHTYFPKGKIKKYIEYKDLFVFQIFLDDPLEGTYDPFYSVNRKTSEFEGFALFKPGVFKEVMDLFDKAKLL